MKSLLAISAVVLFAAGCTSNADLQALRAEVAKSNQIAQQANLNAQDAKAMALRTDEKLNRVFRKSQMK